MIALTIATDNRLWLTDDRKSVISVEGQACRTAIFQRPAAEIIKLHWATLDES